GSGNLNIVDNGNQRIRKIASGNISTVAGKGTGGELGDGAAGNNAMLAQPQGGAGGSSGKLYIPHPTKSRIRHGADGDKFTYAGNNVSGPGYVDAPVATQGQLSLPTAVAVDSAGNLYIAEQNSPNSFPPGNNRIRKVSASGVLTTYCNISGVVGSSGDGGQA